MMRNLPIIKAVEVCVAGQIGSGMKCWIKAGGGGQGPKIVSSDCIAIADAVASSLLDCLIFALGKQCSLYFSHSKMTWHNFIDILYENSDIWNVSFSPHDFNRKFIVSVSAQIMFTYSPFH